LRTVVSLQPTCFCKACGERFQYKKRRGPLLKAISAVADIRKYYCNYCKITYYVFMGAEAKGSKLHEGSGMS
jgi:hypothetical protein